MSSAPALRYLPAALALGLLGDLLLRGTPWGVNLGLFALALVAAALTLVPPADPRVRRDVTALLGAAVVAAAFLGWRDAPPLAAANVLAAVGLLVLAAVRAQGLRLEDAPIRRYAERAVLAARDVALASFRYLTPRPDPLPQWVGPRLRATMVGVVLTLPVLTVFGALLAAADPVFERALRALLTWDFEQLVSHAVLMVIFAWLALGFLVALAGEPRPAADAPGAPGLTLGLVEIGLPLGALAALFAAFVGLQASYLFGGEALIRSTVGLGYADYARRGFFELVTATALVVPLLVAADAAADRSDARVMRGFRALAGVLLALVALVAASALYRLWLYYGAYGLTDTRVYAAAVMLWVGLVLAWFAGTVLRGRRRSFALGALASALAILASLNVLNPDARVARVNLDRGQAGAELDAKYLASLSGDAVPVLGAGLAELPPPARCELAAAVVTRWAAGSAGDWRTWNLGRARAREAAKGLESARCAVQVAGGGGP